MKSYIASYSFILFNAILWVSTPRASASSPCLNPTEDPICDECGVIIPCPEGSSSEGSIIVNGRLTYFHDAVDYIADPDATVDCSSCGLGDANNGQLPSLEIRRRFNSQVGVRTKMFLSFGLETSWRNYDTQLMMTDRGITYMDTTSENSGGRLNFDIARGGWTEPDEQFFGLFLLDQNGQPILAEADKWNARFGTLVRNNGYTEHFEFISDTGGDTRGRLLAIMDRNGNAIQFEYARDFPTWTVHAGRAHVYWQRSLIRDSYGREFRITYNHYGHRSHVSRIELPNGEFIDYEHQGNQGGLTGLQLSKVSYPDGTSSNFSSEIVDDTGLTKLMFFDAGAAPTSRRKEVHLSGLSGFLPDGTQIATIRFQTRKVINGENEINYRNHQLFPAQTYEWRFIHEGGNKVTRARFSEFGGVAESSHVIDDAWKSDFYAENPLDWEVEVTSNNVYNDIPALLGTTDALGRAQAQVRDNTGALTAATTVDGSQVTTARNAFKQPTASTDAIGRQNVISYDANGNKLSETRGLGDPSATTTTYLHNTRGQVIEKRDPLYDPNIPDLHNTQYTYDSAGYLTKTTFSADFSGDPRPEQFFAYDTAGRLSQTTDAAGRVVTYEYDSRNRLVKTTFNDTSTEEITYGTEADANLVIAKKDRNGILTQYTYDLAGRVIQTRTAAGLPEEIVETCTYLPGTSLKEICIKRGEKTVYTYDYRNRLIATTLQATAETALTTSTEYDVLGRRRSSTDAYGRRTFYLYDQNDNLSRTVTETVPEGLGTVPDFSNTSSQTATQTTEDIETTSGETITLSGIHTVSYTDPRDLFLENLTRDLSPNAPYLITDRLTDAEGQTLTTTDPRGIRSLMLYDVLGRVVRTFEAVTETEERLTESDFDQASNLTEVRKPRHFAETDSNGDPIRAVETYTYNGRNLKASHTTAAGDSALEATQSWTYYPDGKPFQYIDFRGNTSTQFWHRCCGRLQATTAQDGQSTTIYNTDFLGNPTHTATVSTDPTLGNTTWPNWHDPADPQTIQETTTRFDGRGRPTHSTTWLQPLGEVDDDARANLGTGEIPIATDPSQGLTTTYTYDEDLTDGQGIDATYATAFTTLATRGTSFNADANGYAMSVTNPAGETTVTVQDSLGRTVMIIDGEGDITTRHYDEILPWSGGPLPAPLADIEIPGALLETKTTDPLGDSTSLFTDAAGRILLSQDALGNPSAAAYDANGNRILTRDANGLGENCTFDLLDRELTCTDRQENAETTQRSKTYNAHNAILTQTDAEGITTTRNTYDVRDRLTTATDGNNLTTAYSYDENNNLLTLTDPESATRSWTYDARNLSIQKNMPGAGDTCTYSYDALSRLKIKTQQDSSAIEMVYDLAGRMTQRMYSDSTTDTFTYDGASRLLTATKGRHAITTTRTYAKDGDQLSETQTLDGRTYPLTRSYDAKGRVTSQTFADGESATWSYDSRDTVTQVRYDGEEMLAQTHDPAYRLAQQRFGNGLVRNITYGRQDNLRTADIVTGTEELTFQYTYAPDKNVLSEWQPSGTFGLLSFTASYDAGNRLSTWQRPDAYPGARETQSWNYNGAGDWNATTIDGDTENRTHNPANETTTVNGQALSYDAKGNLTQDPTRSLEWDIDNRLVNIDSTTNAFSEIHYRYDALGRRIVRKQSNNQEILLWWGNTEQSEHKHQAGQTTIQNDLQANPSEQALNTVFARVLEGNKRDIQYFHKNYLDHVMAVSDDSGDILEHYRYTAFGEPEIYNVSGQKLSASAIQNDILWNVRRYDAQTGLYMYLYRHYDAKLGRWPSRDPIGENGGINLYGFVGNDGLNGVDILGMAGWQWEKLLKNDFTTAYDASMTRRSHGPPALLVRGGAAVLKTLSGMNHTLFSYYLSGAGGQYDLTSNATVKNEVAKEYDATMQADHDKLKAEIEGFQCPSEDLKGESKSYDIGDKKYSEISRGGYTSSIWVIRRASIGISKKVSGTVVCACDPDSGKNKPVSGWTDANFKLYFYDQFADAADIPHKIPGSQEFNGSAQFDEIGAWGKNYSQTGVNHW